MIKKQKRTPAEWLNRRLQSAISFALNYPTECELVKHDVIKKVYKVRYLDGGWYEIDLSESFVRSCIKWQGQKAWGPEADYENIFKEK